MVSNGDGVDIRLSVMDDDLIIDGENNTISFAVCDTACITIDDTLRSKFKRIKIINYHCESGNADALYSLSLIHI